MENDIFILSVAALLHDIWEICPAGAKNKNIVLGMMRRLYCL